MVCDKCQAKVGKVITPDTWKSGARNTTESGGRKINENKALTASKNRFNPYTSKFETCRYCLILLSIGIINFIKNVPFVNTQMHAYICVANCMFYIYILILNILF